MISRCSSPIPEISVWPVSRLTLTRKDGSSRASLASDSPSLSWSALVFGSIAIWMTGSGNSIDSSTIGCAGSHSVSPVVVSRRPTGADVAGEDFFDFLALVGVHLDQRPMRSRLSLVELSTDDPLSSRPEYTRKNVSVPTYGSVMILNASALKGASSRGQRSSVLSPTLPITGGTSSGDGR